MTTNASTLRRFPLFPAGGGVWRGDPASGGDAASTFRLSRAVRKLSCGKSELSHGKSESTASSYFDGTTVHLEFGIPRGADGQDGEPGAEGAPGEVTQAHFDATSANTALNPGSVAALGLSVQQPPTQADVRAIADKLDQLITALRRE